MSPRPDVSEERKKQIVDAAANVFAREGMDKARMDDIADEAGLSKGALYWYFKSKDAIITAILDSVFEREIGRIRSMMDEEEISSRELLQKYTDLVIRDIKIIEPLLPILYEFMAKSFRNKTIRKAIQTYMHNFIDVTVPIIQRGIDRGELKPIDPYDAALSFGSIFEGAIFVWSYDPDSVDLAKTIETSIDLIMQGLEN
jgi:AcrR family transcriptional regulator